MARFLSAVAVAAIYPAIAGAHNGKSDRIDQVKSVVVHVEDATSRMSPKMKRRCCEIMTQLSGYPIEPAGGLGGVLRAFLIPEGPPTEGGRKIVGKWGAKSTFEHHRFDVPMTTVDPRTPQGQDALDDLSAGKMPSQEKFHFVIQSKDGESLRIEDDQMEFLGAGTRHGFTYPPRTQPHVISRINTQKVAPSVSNPGLRDVIPSVDIGGGPAVEQGLAKVFAIFNAVRKYEGPLTADALAYLHAIGNALSKIEKTGNSKATSIANRRLPEAIAFRGRKGGPTVTVGPLGTDASTALIHVAKDGVMPEGHWVGDRIVAGITGLLIKLDAQGNVFAVATTSTSYDPEDDVLSTTTAIPSGEAPRK